MIHTRRFDGCSYTGLTDEDNKNIIEYAEQGIELRIDNYDRVYTESGIYIADVVYVERGNGIYC